MPNRSIRVTNHHPVSSLNTNNTVSLIFDHKALVDRKLSRVDGMDIYAWHPTVGNFPVKVIAPNTDYARACFSVRAPIAANGGFDESYRLHYGYLDRPVENFIQPQLFSQFLARNPTVNPAPNGPFLWFDDWKYYHDGSKWVPTTLLDPPDPGTYNTGGNPFGITAEGLGQIVPTFPPLPPLSYVEVVNSTATVFRVRTEIRVSATFDVIEFLGVAGRITSSGWQQIISEINFLTFLSFSVTNGSESFESGPSEL